MGERYFVTGCQLGLLLAVNDKQRKKLINEIIEKQFIGNYETDEDKERFNEGIKEFNRFIDSLIPHKKKKPFKKLVLKTPRFV